MIVNNAITNDLRYIYASIYTYGGHTCGLLSLNKISYSKNRFLKICNQCNNNVKLTYLPYNNNIVYIYIKLLIYSRLNFVITVLYLS